MGPRAWRLAEGQLTCAKKVVLKCTTANDIESVHRARCQLALLVPTGNTQPRQKHPWLMTQGGM